MLTDSPSSKSSDLAPQAQNLIVSLRPGRTVATIENVAWGSGLLGLIQISFCHVRLRPSWPYGYPESLIGCSVFLPRNGDSFIFYLLATQWHPLLLAKSMCKWNIYPCTGKRASDFDGAPVVCPKHHVIQGTRAVSSTPGHTPVNQEASAPF